GSEARWVLMVMEIPLAHDLATGAENTFDDSTPLIELACFGLAFPLGGACAPPISPRGRPGSVHAVSYEQSFDRAVCFGSNPLTETLALRPNAEDGSVAVCNPRIRL